MSILVTCGLNSQSSALISLLHQWQSCTDLVSFYSFISQAQRLLSDIEQTVRTRYVRFGSQFPSPLLIYIFTFLDRTHGVTKGTVCKHWRNILNSNAAITILQKSAPSKFICTQRFRVQSPPSDEGPSAFAFHDAMVVAVDRWRLHSFVVLQFEKDSSKSQARRVGEEQESRTENPALHLEIYGQHYVYILWDTGEERILVAWDLRSDEKFLEWKLDPYVTSFHIPLNQDDSQKIYLFSHLSVTYSLVSGQSLRSFVLHKKKPEVVPRTTEVMTSGVVLNDRIFVLLNNRDLQIYTLEGKFLDTWDADGLMHENEDDDDDCYKPHVKIMCCENWLILFHAGIGLAAVTPSGQLLCRLPSRGEQDIVASPTTGVEIYLKTFHHYTCWRLG